MRYALLAVDFDGTLAHDERVAPRVWAALDRAADSGRSLVLVTGRLLDDLLRLLERPDRFRLIVAENGALVYDPASGAQRTLVDPPPEQFAAELARLGVTPLEIGRVVVATREPHETTVLEAIRALGLEWHLIFNKGAVMALPAVVTKASGLAAALTELRVSPHNVVAVGDGENDAAMLAFAECGVAVANAVPALQARADAVASAPNGDGVVEVLDALVAHDLRGSRRGRRHRLIVGSRADGSPVALEADARGVLVLGTSGGGKSSLTTLFMERLVDAGYQFCATDPEGDYESFEGAVILGRSDVAPDPTAILETLRTPAQSVVANLLALPQDDRPAFFASLADATADLSRAAGRPHWLVIDEAHHFLPAGTDARLPAERGSVFMVTTRAELLSPRALEALDAIVAFGDEAPALLASALKRIGADPAPAASSAAPQTGRALFWDGSVVADFQPDAARVRRIRHRRKYAFGSLADSKTFYFRGPEGRLNLRAANLMTFAELAKGVDDDTWLFHLRRGDYSRWFAQMVGDEELAQEAHAVERDEGLTAAEGRERIVDAIAARYTSPA